MATRRLRKDHAHLEVTAFINLIVVLVPFLLSTAVFSRLAVLELSLPTPSAGVEQLQVAKLQLEVVIRPDALEVGDRVGGLIQRIAHGPQGPDTHTLNAVIHQIKQKYPQQTDATVLAQPDTSYELLVAVMDAMRSTRSAQDGRVVTVELFPKLSIGDAPRGAK